MHTAPERRLRDRNPEVRGAAEGVDDGGVGPVHVHVRPRIEDVLDAGYLHVLRPRLQDAHRRGVGWRRWRARRARKRLADRRWQFELRRPRRRRRRRERRHRRGRHGIGRDDEHERAVRAGLRSTTQRSVAKRPAAPLRRAARAEAASSRASTDATEAMGKTARLPVAGVPAIGPARGTGRRPRAGARAEAVAEAEPTRPLRTHRARS
jgi:hypothetical protein